MRQRTARPGLKPLDALVGEWELAATIAGELMPGGRTRFKWIEGGAFLAQHAEATPPAGAPPEWVANWPFPVTTIMGLDDATGRFSMLYADGRGVCRVYEMSLADSVWKTWRNAPGFFQRFTGAFDGADTIRGRWEKSEDGANWTLDFELIYRKVRA